MEENEKPVSPPETAGEKAGKAVQITIDKIGDVTKKAVHTVSVKSAPILEKAGKALIHKAEKILHSDINRDGSIGSDPS